VRIAIDAQTALGEVRSGVGEYTYRLLQGLALLESEDQYTLYYGYARRVASEPSIAGSDRFRSASSLIPGRLRELLIGRLHLPIEMVVGRCDVVHVPFGRVPATARARRVVTVHDINFLLQPRSWHSDSNWQTLQGVIQGAKAADHIVADSAYTKEQIVERLGIPDQRISVVHLSLGRQAEEFFARAESRSLAASCALCPQEPYALYVGAIEERKGLTFLLDAYKHYRMIGGEHKLVLVGFLGREVDKHMRHAEELGIAPHLSFLGHVPEEELLKLYLRADIFVFPSVWEGFGLPLLEALSAGRAIVARSACSIPEVVGDAGVLVSSDVPADFAQAVYDVTSSPSRRSELEAAASEQATRFSLRTMAEKTAEVYRRS